jgi:F-type H+-transporting ATPase subunit gamma
MASLRDIKKRIQSIKNIEKITKAMKMVAASKFKKAHDNSRKGKVYLFKIEEVIQNILLTVDKETIDSNPMFRNHKNKNNVTLFVLTSDRGLCGSFNNNIIRQALSLINQCKVDYSTIDIINIGKKGYNALKKIKNVNIQDSGKLLPSKVFSFSQDLANDFCKKYIEEKIDCLWILGNHFKNPVLQETKLQRIMPLKQSRKKTSLNNIEYIYEPSKENLLNILIPKYFSAYIYQNILESIASEHAARMQAMGNATKSAKEMFEALTLKYNRARQTNITRELMEIISGAEAIK